MAHMGQRQIVKMCRAVDKKKLPAVGLQGAGGADSSPDQTEESETTQAEMLHARFTARLSPVVAPQGPVCNIWPDL